MRSARRSGCRSRRSICLCAQATCATRGPMSRKRGGCSATSRPSRSRTGCSSPPSTSSALAEAGREPVRILRVIARLNMGGPALHVAYLSAGLRERGYETTLVAGTLARGEDSMSFVADELGVRVETLPELSREISPLKDVRAAIRLAHLIRRERPQ